MAHFCAMVYTVMPPNRLLSATFFFIQIGTFFNNNLSLYESVSIARQIYGKVRYRTLCFVMVHYILGVRLKGRGTPSYT